MHAAINGSGDRPKLLPTRTEAVWSRESGVQSWGEAGLLEYIHIVMECVNEKTLRATLYMPVRTA